jgi:cell division protein FtsL
VNILRSSFIPGLIVLAISASFLFIIKHKVQNLDRNLKQINAQILMEKENIHVLNAELAYLTNPKRIKKLANEKLHLQIPKAEQIVSLEELPQLIIKKQFALFKKGGEQEE